jgi:hypothetical protein
MPRYIIIDLDSGFIFGDTGDLDGPARQETPLDACRRLDRSLGEFEREYVEYGPNSNQAFGLNRSIYDVYRADIKGSEAVPLVHDGQDQETINSVIASCDHVATVVTYSSYPV